jgi:hypothetical protein
VAAVKTAKCCDIAVIRATVYYKQGMLFPNSHLKELKETMKNLNQGSQSPTSDMNLGSIR